jgi:hypothetical protein
VFVSCTVCITVRNNVRIHLDEIIELCLTVFCLYFIILYNTTGLSHLKVKVAVDS